MFVCCTLPAGNPVLLHTFTPAESAAVWGVTHLNKTIYAVRWQSNRIAAYSGQQPYQQLQDIVVEGLTGPIDIVACSNTAQLFVADWRDDGGVIWRIDVAANTAGEWLRIPYKPWTMSLTSGRLVVRPIGEKALYIYNVADGQLMERIPLPDNMIPQHAVETASGEEFVVCHIAPTGTGNDQVSIVDNEGRVIRGPYGGERGAGQQELNRPEHVALDSVGRVLVADTYNSRIVLLNAQLQFERILLEQLSDQPNRLHYNEQNHELVVGLNDGSVNVYRMVL